MKYIQVMFITFVFLFGVTLGHDLGVREEPNWVQNAPKVIVEHKDRLCYGWEGKYESQVVACIKRGK